MTAAPKSTKRKRVSADAAPRICDLCDFDQGVRRETILRTSVGPTHSKDAPDHSWQEISITADLCMACCTSLLQRLALALGPLSHHWKTRCQSAQAEQAAGAAGEATLPATRACANTPAFCTPAVSEREPIEATKV